MKTAATKLKHSRVRKHGNRQGVGYKRQRRSEKEVDETTEAGKAQVQSDRLKGCDSICGPGFSVLLCFPTEAWGWRGVQTPLFATCCKRVWARPRPLNYL